MIEDPIPVVIGGVTFLCPPMPFYCLERAWPHIQAMGRMGQATQALAAAQLQVRTAVTAADHDSATANEATAQQHIAAIGGDFIGQTREAIAIIAISLALDSNPPSYDDLAKRVRQSELAGVHIACALLMDGSGLTKQAAGEAQATPQMMPSLNGTGTSPN